MTDPAGDPAAPTRSARRRARTRAVLIAAGREVMAERGVDAATIQEITDRADVGFGSFYNHFDGKDQLLDAIVEAEVARLALLLDSLTADEDDPARVVARALRELLAVATRDTTWGWLLIRIFPLRHRLLAILGARVLRDVERGASSGRFQVRDPHVAALAVGGAVFGIVRAHLDGEVGVEAHEPFIEGALRMLGLTRAQARATAEWAMRSADSDE